MQDETSDPCLKKIQYGWAIVIVPVTRKRFKMAPYGGLSHLWNEFGDPQLFFCFYYEHIINFSLWRQFQQILISRTITDESP